MDKAERDIGNNINSDGVFNWTISKVFQKMKMNFNYIELATVVVKTGHIAVPPSGPSRFDPGRILFTGNFRSRNNG